MRKITWRYRIPVLTWRQLTAITAMLIICYYGVMLYTNSISVDPYFLNYIPVPSPASLTDHEKKLVALSKQYSELAPDPKLSTSYRGLSYIEVVTKLASPEKLIVLALIDGGFLQIALNYYISCLKGFEIDNYLLLATDQASCDRLLAVGIHCYVYRQDLSAKEASVYHSPAFLRKMNIRTDMILEALRAGFQVVHSDVDIVCQKHMLENLNCPDCDVAPLWDKFAYNAGFLYIRPTLLGIQVYERMSEMVKQNTTLDDQKQLNNVIDNMTYYHSDFKVKELGEGYKCGLDYYETPARFFAPDASPCPECVVIHNNWIVSMEAKVYRAKEMHQWMYDGSQYYSSTKRKYLVYDNPLVGRYVAEAEKQALVNALAFGEILNRTVILPKFHCNQAHCPLNSIISIKLFDEQFGGAYREHSFLSHPLVPSSVRRSTYGPVLLKTRYLVGHMAPYLDVVPQAQEVDLERKSTGMTDSEVREHFEQVPDVLLRFFSLYGAFSGFIDPVKHDKFMAKVARGIVDDAYINGAALKPVD